MEVILISKEEYLQLNNKLDKVLSMLDEKAKDTKLYNVTETAEKLGVTRQTLHNYIRYGLIETKIVGNKTFFTDTIITNFLSNGNTKHITHKASK